MIVLKFKVNGRTGNSRLTGQHKIHKATQQSRFIHPYLPFKNRPIYLSANYVPEINVQKSDFICPQLSYKTSCARTILNIKCYTSECCKISTT